MDSNSPGPGDKPPVAPLELPPDYSNIQEGGSNKKSIILVIVAIVLVVGAFGLWQLMSSSGPGASTENHPTTTFGK